MKNSSRILTLAALLAVSANTAFADSISFTAPVVCPWNACGGGINSAVTLPQFDGSLGTLDSVTLFLTGHATGYLQLTSGDEYQEAAFVYGYEVSVEDIPGPVDALGTLTVISLSGIPASGLSFEFSPPDVSLALAPEVAGPMFTGPGHVTFPVNTFVYTLPDLEGFGFAFEEHNYSDADVTVTYGYTLPGPTPIPNPEPATLVLLGSGLAGAVGIARRKRGSQTTSL